MKGYWISTDINDFDLDVIHSFLTKSYWSPGIPKETLRKGISNSLSFAVLTDAGQQVGFARMITDKATYAYLADVFIFVNRGIPLPGLLLCVCLIVGLCDVESGVFPEQPYMHVDGHAQLLVVDLLNLVESELHIDRHLLLVVWPDVLLVISLQTEGQCFSDIFIVAEWTRIRLFASVGRITQVFLRVLAKACGRQESQKPQDQSITCHSSEIKVTTLFPLLTSFGLIS